MGKIKDFIFSKPRLYWILSSCFIFTVILLVIQIQNSTDIKAETANLTTIISAGFTLIGLYLTIYQQIELRKEVDIISNTRQQVKKEEVERKITRGDILIDNIIEKLTSDNRVAVIPNLNELKKIFLNCQNEQTVDFNKEECTRFLKTINSSIVSIQLNTELNLNDFIAELLEMKDTLTDLAINCD